MQISFMLSVSPNADTSLTADLIVRVIFVPVSPSGTGNTFSSLIHSLFASKLAAPAKNIPESSLASIALVVTASSSCI